MIHGLPVSSSHFLFELVPQWSFVTDLNHQQVLQMRGVAMVKKMQSFMSPIHSYHQELVVICVIQPMEDLRIHPQKRFQQCQH